MHFFFKLLFEKIDFADNLHKYLGPECSEIYAEQTF